MKLRIDQIEATAATQVRKKLDRAVIADYQEALEAGAIFPPVDVFAEKGSQRYILADGFHRIHATVDADIETIEVNVHEGGLHDALVYALGANEGHGLRRTSSDKRNAVMLALKDPQLSKMSFRDIGDVCRVSHEFVRQMKQDQVTGKTEKKAKVSTVDTEKHVRPSRPEPTQDNSDRRELRGAIATFKALPYGGDGAAKLELTADDAADLAYVSEWCAEAVKAVLGRDDE